MSIGLLYERSENDENGIKLTAEQLGIDLKFIPFRKIAISIGKDGFKIASKGKDYTQETKDIGVVLNRAQSKNRRLYAAHTMEVLEKRVINSSSIEFLCYSKFRTLLHFWALGLPIPKTAYVPCDAFDTTKDGRVIHNEPDIALLLEKEIGSQVVVKPDAGTHGKGIALAKNHKDLIARIGETEPSIINPVGVIGQERIKKWFYDLRIIVMKEKTKAPACHPIAMARAGFGDFRTNTFLGNLVFDAKLPRHIRELAVKCGKALGRDCEAWVFALDAMVSVQDKAVDDQEVKKELSLAGVSYADIKKVKADDLRLTNFEVWNEKLEAAYKDYMSTEPYQKIKGIIDDSVESNRLNVVFHEANSCPEFWENTRPITGLNVAVPLLMGAESLLK